jgi:small subunit ribosomal protein S11
MPDQKPKTEKRSTRITRGRAYIQATYNNTIISITDLSGNVLAWSSAGALGFKGPKKATPYAAGKIVEDVIGKLEGSGLAEVEVYLKGIGSGREAAVRALQANGIEVASITERTPVPHNGTRPKKVRRV